MTKKMVQDVLPPEEKSIRRIPLSDRQRNRIFPSQRQKEQEVNNQSDQDNIPPPKRKKVKYWMWGLGIILLLILVKIFAFAEAQVIIKPKQQSVNFNEVFIASSGSEVDNSEIPFELITISQSDQRVTEAGGEEHVERAASGEIIIFNNHSSNSQILIQNTRFETPEGLIYRIREPVTVPGTTRRNGETVPGQLKVKVFADQPGEKYNIGLTDFTIPGFKGLPQFKNFFARSATEMTGGFSGVTRIVDQGSLEIIRTELRDNLHSVLRDRILKETPKDFLLIEGNLQITFESSTENEGEDSVIVRETGKAAGLMLDKKRLEESLVEKSLGRVEEVEVINLDELSIRPTSDNLGNVETVSSFEFIVAGNGKLVWIIDQDAIKKALAGQSRKDINSLLSQYPAIEEARAATKPFWKRSFPKKERRIYVDIKLD